MIRFLARRQRSMAIHTLADNSIGCAFYEKLGGRDGGSTVWNGFPGKWYVWPDLESAFGEMEPGGGEVSS